MSKSKKEFSAEEVAQIGSLYNGGQSASYVAKVVGATPAQVIEALRANGIAVRGRGRPSKELLAKRAATVGAAPVVEAVEAAVEAPAAEDSAVPAEAPDPTVADPAPAEASHVEDDSPETEVSEVEDPDGEAGDDEPVETDSYEVAEGSGEGEVVAAGGGFRPDSVKALNCIDPLDGSTSVRYRCGVGPLMHTPELAFAYRRRQ